MVATSVLVVEVVAVLVARLVLVAQVGPVLVAMLALVVLVGRLVAWACIRELPVAVGSCCGHHGLGLVVDGVRGDWGCPGGLGRDSLPDWRSAVASDSFVAVIVDFVWPC